MPMNPESWMSAETLRKEAAKWDDLAAAARLEGDKHDEALCAGKATECRRLARRKEADG